MHSSRQPEDRQAVVLIHGIWVGGWVMRPLARFLDAHGYATSLFAYPSVRRSPIENAALLQRHVDAIEAPQIHFVAHSLGGVLLLNFFKCYPDQGPGRLVVLGSPLNGSAKARRILALPLGRRMLGRSVIGGLLDGGLCCPPDHEVGVIAGSRALGLGLLLGPFHQPNDGTVAVAETRLDGLRDHLVLKTSHTGMLLSRQVAAQVLTFLRDGRFRH